MLLFSASNYSPLLGPNIFSAPNSQAVHSVFLPPHGRTNFTILQSTKYNLFFHKTTGRQTLVKETDANIPRISSVRSPLANEILRF